MQEALAGFGAIVKRRRHAILAALLLPTLLSLFVLWVKSTHAYGLAERFVHQDARIAVLIGKVNRVDFLFWHGFSYLGGDADFSFQATSGKGSYIVDVGLRQILGTWRVQEADITPRDGEDTFLVLN